MTKMVTLKLKVKQIQRIIKLSMETTTAQTLNTTQTIDQKMSNLFLRDDFGIERNQQIAQIVIHIVLI